MKTMSISKLEYARNHPENYAKMLNGTVTQEKYFGGRTKFVRWQDSVHHYLKTDNLDTAVSYLENSFSKRKQTKKNIDEVVDYSYKLGEFVNDFNMLGYINMEHRKNIEIVITDKLRMTGQVPIINLNLSGGYSAFFFSKGFFDWENELKFPIVQNYLAEQVYGVNNSEVEVGIFSFDTLSHYSVSFTDNEIQSAKKELHKLGSLISKYL